MPTPAERRRARDRRRRKEAAERRKREARQEKRQDARQQRRERVNKMGLLRPEQRQDRIQDILRGGVKRDERRRLALLRESRTTANAKAVKSMLDLTPEQRAKRISAIFGNRELNDAQQRLRSARVRASGRVGKFDPNGPNEPPGGTPPPVPGLPPPAGDNYLDLLEGEQRNAFSLIMLEFDRMGLGRGLARQVYDAVVAGVTNVDMILQLVRQSDVYKQRFPGMALRDSSLPAISEGEYIDLERQYRAIMSTAGLPNGFYDQPSDFAKFIGNDMSPTELQGRVDIARSVAQSVDPFQRNLLSDFYGIGTGELTAHFLDQKRALPILEREVNASGVAVFARNVGLLQGRGIPDFGRLVDLGVSPEEAKGRYGEIESTFRGINRFDFIYGADYSIDDAEKEGFFGDSTKSERLIKTEQATWSGGSRGQTGTGSKRFQF